MNNSIIEIKRKDLPFKSFLTTFECILKEPEMDEQIKKMNKIINPLITVKEGDKYKILAGNNRFLAGLELGYTEFPIKVIQGETVQDIRKAMEDYVPINLDE